MTGEPEEWRPVLAWEGLYEVSSLGRVKSLARTKGGRFNKCGVQSVLPVPERILKCNTTRTGYVLAVLCRDSECYPKSVHRLVCAAFHGPAPAGRNDVAHFDGVRSNNRASNLRWASDAENYADRWRHGTETAGIKNGNAELTDELVTEIRISSESVGRIARRLGLDRSTIYAARVGRSWKHVEAPARSPMHNGRQKITPDQVRKIRADPRVARLVALEYGLCAGTVQQIRSRKLWPHIE